MDFGSVFIDARRLLCEIVLHELGKRDFPLSDKYRVKIPEGFLRGIGGMHASGDPVNALFPEPFGKHKSAGGLLGHKGHGNHIIMRVPIDIFNFFINIFD